MIKRLINRRKRRRKKKEKEAREEKLRFEAENLRFEAENEIKLRPIPENEIIHTEMIRIPKPDFDSLEAVINLPKKKPRTRVGKLFGWIKKHVRPDIGLGPMREGEGPDFRNDDLYDIADKLKENLRVGLKITFKF